MSGVSLSAALIGITMLAVPLSACGAQTDSESSPPTTVSGDAAIPGPAAQTSSASTPRSATGTLLTEGGVVIMNPDGYTYKVEWLVHWGNLLTNRADARPGKEIVSWEIEGVWTYANTTPGRRAPVSPVRNPVLKGYYKSSRSVCSLDRVDAPNPYYKFLAFPGDYCSISLGSPTVGGQPDAAIPIGIGGTGEIVLTAKSHSEVDEGTDRSIGLDLVDGPDFIALSLSGTKTPAGRSLCLQEAAPVVYVYAKDQGLSGIQYPECPR